MLDASGHNEHLTGANRDAAIAKRDFHLAIDDQECLVGFVVAMPHKLALDFHELELVVVHFRNNARRPMLGELGELILEVDHVGWHRRVTLSARRCGRQHRGGLSCGEPEIGAQIFECGGADAFYSSKVFEFLVGRFTGMRFLELVAVFDNSTGHGGAKVGEGGEIGGGGGVGVELVEEFGGAGTLEGLRRGDAGGMSHVEDEEVSEDEQDQER
jgi:hypothetical protein